MTGRSRASPARPQPSVVSRPATAEFGRLRFAATELGHPGPMPPSSPRMTSSVSQVRLPPTPVIQAQRGRARSPHPPPGSVSRPARPASRRGTTPTPADLGPDGGRMSSSRPGEEVKQYVTTVADLVLPRGAKADLSADPRRIRRSPEKET